ncbi:EamA family transporter RarD [Zavarzinia sp.]|uniref:EamA family transporter RarD n=1 Tax=Zavarzinia sp. TaxID=2027920 RepID=UPI0035638620
MPEISVIRPGSEARATALAGAAYAVAAYTAWAMLALYWKALTGVPPFEVMLHRAVWSTLFLFGLVFANGRGAALHEAFRAPRALLALGLTAALLAANWYLFIWAMQSGFALEASLGYYINPLVNVLLGVVVLRESLSRIRRWAVGLATLGVTVLTVYLGVPPWVALILAATFGIYGLLRKMTPVDPIVGLAVESLWMAIFAAPILAFMEVQGSASLGRLGLRTDIMLIAAGVVTAVPLIWFNAAAKRLTLSTLGLFQYIAPTGMFLIAVFVNGEPFTAVHMVTFALIWLALGLVAVESLRVARRIEGA